MFNRFSHFLSTHTHMKKSLTLIGIALCVIFSFAIGIWSRPAPVVQPANAEWSQEALNVVENIKTANANWKTADANLTAAKKLLDDANTDKMRAEAAGKGADLTLCASFQARYDRVTGKIVADENCPLL